MGEKENRSAACTPVFFFVKIGCSEAAPLLQLGFVRCSFAQRKNQRCFIAHHRRKRRWVRLTIASNRKASRAKPSLVGGGTSVIGGYSAPLRIPLAPHRLVFLFAWFVLSAPRRGGACFSIGGRSLDRAAELCPCGCDVHQVCNTLLFPCAVSGAAVCLQTAVADD